MAAEYAWIYKGYLCRIEEVFDGGELKAFHFVTRPKRKTEILAPLDRGDFSRKTLELWIDASLPRSDDPFTRESLEKITGKKITSPPPVVHPSILEHEKRLATIRRIQEQEFAPDPEPEQKIRTRRKSQNSTSYQGDERDEPDYDPEFYSYGHFRNGQNWT